MINNLLDMTGTALDALANSLTSPKPLDMAAVNAFLEKNNAIEQKKEVYKARIKSEKKAAKAATRRKQKAARRRKAKSGANRK